MSIEPTPKNNVPDLPDDLDGLPDDRPADSPPASEDPGNPDAHGPIVQA